MTTEPAVLKDEPPRPSPEPTAAPDPQTIAPSVEAILLAMDRPIAPSRIAEVLGLAPTPQPTGTGEGQGDEGPRPRRRRRGRGGPADGVGLVERAIAHLNEAYEATGRSFRIAPVAGGYRLMTRPEFAPVLAALQRTRQSGRLSRAAIETLAIIAYRQPITRAHLEAIRGVACGEVLRSLMERRLVTITGRAEELGRPILYGTTREFLDAFGLASLKDLPTVAELQPSP